jgi:phenylalanyl-tRNA synthetase beta chain
VWLLELRVGPLVAAEVPPVHVLPLPRHPAVARDLSLICDAGREAASLVDVVRRAGGERLRSAFVADRYAGPPVPAGRVSLMLSLRYQDPSRTLTSEEVDASVAAIQSALRAAGAEIRGE